GELIAATGGGIVLRKENRAVIKKAGKVILLKASLPEILSRIGGCAGRPLLDREHPLETIKTMLEEREPYYIEYEISFDTTGKTVSEVCEEIMEKLQL
ncbi:MAG: shikimate kinase, partial [Dethiobacteria bacterium]